MKTLPVDIEDQPSRGVGAWHAGSAGHYHHHRSVRRVLRQWNELRRRDFNFPEDPKVQLWGALGLSSGMNDPAKVYRRMPGVSESRRPTVTIQPMVLGKMGEPSATSVALTPEPSRGEDAHFGQSVVNDDDGACHGGRERA